MTKTTQQRLLLLGVMLLAIVAAAPTAQASLTLMIDNPATPGIDRTVSDLDADGDLLYFGGIGTFNVVVAQATSKPLLGGPHECDLDMISVIISGGTGTLNFSLTDTDYSFSDQYSGQRFGLQSEVEGSTTGSITLQSYLDFANTPFGQGVTTGVQGAFTSGQFMNSRMLALQFADASPFSLTQQVTVTHSSGTQRTDFHILTRAHAPEPATMVAWSLLGSLSVAGAWLRRRKAQA